MALRCFDHAFALADDNTTADVWYNIGQVAVGMAMPCACESHKCGTGSVMSNAMRILLCLRRNVGVCIIANDVMALPNVLAECRDWRCNDGIPSL